MNKRPNRTEADLPSQGVVRDSEPFFATTDILFHNDEYLVINKPANLRMDGAFDHTLEKLVCKWLPSLATTSLKWVHQLDYATSGVLCIGLTRPAAARASLAFAERLTRKQYLAVVRGHIDPLKYRSATTSSSSSSSSYVRPLENPTSKKTKTAAPITPSDSALRSKRWQNEAKLTNLSVCYTKLLATQQSSGAAGTSTEEVVVLDLSILAKRSLAEFKKSAKLRKQLRKALKAYGIHHDFVLPPTEEFCGDGDDNVDVNAAVALDIVRDSEDDFSDSIYRLVDDDCGSDDSLLMVTVPVAEAENDFRCYASRRHGKPCETTLRVLEYASYKGLPVTKVLLLPKTGRRHQLRVHCLALGHPILGDYTYGLNSKLYWENDDINHTVSPPSCIHPRHEPALEDSTCARMFLHAWKLHVPLTTPTQVKKRKQGLAVTDEGLLPTVLVDVCTNDPFIVQNGILLDS